MTGKRPAKIDIGLNFLAAVGCRLEDDMSRVIDVLFEQRQNTIVARPQTCEGWDWLDKHLPPAVIANDGAFMLGKEEGLRLAQSAIADGLALS